MYLQDDFLDLARGDSAADLASLAASTSTTTSGSTGSCDNPLGGSHHDEDSRTTFYSSAVGSPPPITEYQDANMNSNNHSLEDHNSGCSENGEFDLDFDGGSENGSGRKSSLADTVSVSVSEAEAAVSSILPDDDDENNSSVNDEDAEATTAASPSPASNIKLEVVDPERALKMEVDPEVRSASGRSWDQDVLLSNAGLPEANPLLDDVENNLGEDFQKMLNDWENHINHIGLQVRLYFYHESLKITVFFIAVYRYV